MAGKIKKWKVLENYTASDHQYISFKIGELAKRRNTKTTREMKKGWKVNKLDAATLIETITNKGGCLSEENAPLAFSKTAAENLVERTMSLIEHACNKSMPRRTAKTNRDPVYWWISENLSDLFACLTWQGKCFKKCL